MKRETLAEYEHIAMSLCYMGMHVHVTVNLAPQDHELISGVDLPAFLDKLKSSGIKVEVNVLPDQNFERSIHVRALSER